MEMKEQKKRLGWENVAPFICALLVSVSSSLAGPGGKEIVPSRSPMGFEVCATSEGSPVTARTQFGERSWNYLQTTKGALERLRSKVEEWGVATISAPVAIWTPGTFKIPGEILPSIRDVYNEVKQERSATVAQSMEVGVSNQLGVVATPMLPFPAATAPAGGTATNSTTSTTTVTSPSPPPMFDAQGQIRPTLRAEAMELPARASVGGITSSLAPFSHLGQLGVPTGSVSHWHRRASNIAIEQKIFSAMSDPSATSDAVIPLFCVVQVSVNPGWRTQQNYLADCAASLEYYDLCKKKPLSRAERRQPTVFSVLPLIDAQTVEMANSQRELTQLAFQLAASLPARGVDIKAKDLFEFVRRYSKDARSVTPIPVVNSYSSGSTFGFRFSPSFQAMHDPAAKNAKNANVLLPTSFPALVTVLLRKVDLAAAVQEMTGTAVTDESGLDPLPAGFSVMTHVSTRWYLKDRPPLWKLHKRLFSPMKRDTAGIEIGAAEDVATVYWAKEWYQRYEGIPFPQEAEYTDTRGRVRRGGNSSEGPDDQRRWSASLDEVRRQILDLESKGLGRSWPIDISGNWLTLAREAKEQQQSLAVEAPLKAKIKQLEADLRSAQDSAKKALQDAREAENKNLWDVLKGLGHTSALSTGVGTQGTASSLRELAPAPEAQPAITDLV
jgi:hypothetical protein